MLNINSRTTCFIVIGVLVVLIALLFGQYLIVYQDLRIAETTLQKYEYNDKILVFFKLFITKILKAQSEVSFEDRLQLENSVRNINNKEIFDQWQKFTECDNEIQAQAEVKNLLEILVSKIAI